MKKFIAMFMCAALMACVSVSAQDIYKTAANVPMVQLNNGVLMPQFGLGTFMQPSDAICKQSCLTALKAGYRHIDTAHAYNDERGVGEAVKESGIPREEIWITSKLWPTEYGEGKTLKAIDEMLARLQTDYIDLLYVHQPVGDFVGAWKDMPPLRTTAGHAREGKTLRNPHHLLVPIGRCDEQRRIVERPDNHENSRITWQDGCTGNSSLAHSRGVLGHSGRNES